MIDLFKIKEYYKSGKGFIFQFYITDEELQTILTEKLPQEFEPYSLICFKYHGNELYTFEENAVEFFVSARTNGCENFFLRSHKLTPEIEIPGYQITSSVQRAHLMTYYIYNGLIDIQHGFRLRHKFFSESSIGLIGKYYMKSDPDTIYLNEGYTSVFAGLKKGIKNFLKFKSKETWLDGRINISKSNNVSEGFLAAVKDNKIITQIEII